MKKLLTLSLLLVVAVQFTGCKNEKKKEALKKETKTFPFSLKTSKNSVNWIAYKTTDKLPVKGKFKKVNITKNGEGNTAKEAIQNAEFSIPVSSLFTADVSRDFKLKKFFFGVMENTKLLSGKLSLTNDTNGVASISMNGVTANLPFTYTLVGKEFKLTATMNLDNWNATKAVNALNEACKDLHKAKDGISKTWSDVAISIDVTF